MDFYLAQQDAALYYFQSRPVLSIAIFTALIISIAINIILCILCRRTSIRYCIETQSHIDQVDNTATEVGVLGIVKATDPIHPQLPGPTAPSDDGGQDLTFRSYVSSIFASSLRRNELLPLAQLTRGQVYPLYVPCVVQILINQRRYQRSRTFPILWQFPDEYEECLKLAKAQLRTNLDALSADEIDVTEHNTPDTRFYELPHQLKVFEEPSGHRWLNGLEQTKLTELVCRRPSRTILSDASCEESSASAWRTGEKDVLGDTMLYSKSVSQQGAWATTASDLLGTFLPLQEHSKSMPRLEIELSYNTYKAHVDVCDSDTDCFKEIDEVLFEKKVWQAPKMKNDGGAVHENVWFVPSTFMTTYFTEQLLEHLIDRIGWSAVSGKANDDGGVEKADFVRQIILNGVQFLAITISAGLDLKFLYQLWKAGTISQKLPLTPAHTPEGVNEKDFVNKFLDSQSHFSAYRFPDSRAFQNHQSIPLQKTLPIVYEREVGEGAHGTVFAIKIHEEQHNFPTDRGHRLAMKRLRHDGKKTKQLEDELRNLQTLFQVPHEHLTTFLGSFDHGDDYFMLFPLAEADLYTFLRDQTTSILGDTPSIKWLVSQLHGLAGAISHIHHLAPSGVQHEGQTGKQQALTSKKGVHFDLSLRNILVFRKGKQYILKISDFGTVRFRPLVSSDLRPGGSYQYKDRIGNEEYAPPETEVLDGIGRPFDIFSLGCIFLCISCWALERYDLMSFQEERKFEGQENQDPCFYCPGTENFHEGDKSDQLAFGKCGEKFYELKPSVRQRLRWLKNDDKERILPAYGQILRYVAIRIQGMLAIESSKRPGAPDIESDLKHFGLEIDNKIVSGDADQSQVFALPSTHGGSPVLERPRSHSYDSGPRPRSVSESSPVRGIPRPQQLVPPSPTIPGTLRGIGGGGDQFGDLSTQNCYPKLMLTDHDKEQAVESSANSSGAITSKIPTHRERNG